MKGYVGLFLQGGAARCHNESWGDGGDDEGMQPGQRAPWGFLYVERWGGLGGGGSPAKGARNLWGPGMFVTLIVVVRASVGTFQMARWKYGQFTVHPQYLGKGAEIRECG